MAQSSPEMTAAEIIGNLRQKIELLENQYHVIDSLLENATDAIQISDRNLVTLRVKRAYEVLTGIKREELVGISVTDLVQKRLISASCGTIVQKTKKPCTIVQTFYRTGRSAHVSCNPVFDEQGEIEFYICNDRDLDEISSLQSELHVVRELNDRYLSELETIKSLLPNRGELVIEDQAMLKVLALANRVAKVDSTVLILGETGVGKDEIARFIHHNSSRTDKPFVSINCGAITESLFESELFGHEGNAFTGAGRKVKLGLLEVATEGTLFLDEIGELSLNMQTKLLHVLQSQSFIRVGGNRSVRVNVRILAATNCDLELMVREKRFREDLYYRLNVIPIYIPPLRERKNDIIPLTQHFLKLYNEKYALKKKFSLSAADMLRNCPWEGNVRQLKNTVEQVVIMTDGEVIHAEDLPIEAARRSTLDTPLEQDGSMGEILEKIELKYLNYYYEKHGNIRQAAQALQMSPFTFFRHRAMLAEKHTDGLSGSAQSQRHRK